MRGYLKLLTVLTAAAVLLLGAGMLWAGPQKKAEPQTLPQDKRPVMAVTLFQPLKEKKKGDYNPAPLRQHLTLRLAGEGFFNIPQFSTLAGDNPRDGLDKNAPLNYQLWSGAGVRYVIKGAYEASGKKLVLEMRLYDVAKGQNLFAKRYSGRQDEALDMMDAFASEVIKATMGLSSLEGSKIVFVTGERGAKEVMSAEYGSRQKHKQLSKSKNGQATQPVLGPDRKVAWVQRNNNKWELVLNGKVVSSGELHMTPAFMPDGTLVAAISDKSGINIFKVTPKGKIPLTKRSGINISPAFSPDGRRMVYVSDQSGGARLFMAPVGGGGSPLGVSGKATDPAWSPRGDLIAFVLKEKHICVIRPDGSGFQQLTSGSGSNLKPTFSPDGRFIAYASTRGGKSQIYIMDINGGGQRPLLTGYGPAQYLPHWGAGE